MDLEDIKIKVSPTIAKAFNAFPENEQERCGILFGAIVRRPVPSREEGLAEFKRISWQARKQAEENGLTPEKLNAILNDK